jgi:putative sigma-54 modulation protein
MRLELTGRHLAITPPLRRLVEKKLARLERLLNDRALSAQVVLSNLKRGCRADVTLHARGEKFLHGVGSAATWDTSMTEATDKLIQQFAKVKGKWEERRRRGVKAGGAGTPEREQAASAVPRPPGVRPRMPKVFRASRQSVRSMSVSEAVREVERNGEGVVVFRDPETTSLTVLFRRSNGELTLVETEA